MESLLLLALFLLLPLVEQLVKFVRRRAEAAPAASGPPPAPVMAGPPPVEETARRPLRVGPRPSAPLPTSRPLAPPAVPPPGAPRRGAKRWLHSRTGLRRAVVLMTILGPCRALEPDSFQQGSR
ncbi:MAG: hypothetical protein AB7P34_19185 [Vicinamibacterales bacterium]